MAMGRGVSNRQQHWSGQAESLPHLGPLIVLAQTVRTIQVPLLRRERQPQGASGAGGLGPGEPAVSGTTLQFGVLAPLRGASFFCVLKLGRFGGQTCSDRSVFSQTICDLSQ